MGESLAARASLDSERSTSSDAMSPVAVTSADPMRGDRGALVAFVVFSDFQCPFCRRLETTLDSVLFKEEPLSFHVHAEPAAELALEARAEKATRPTGSRTTSSSPRSPRSRPRTSSASGAAWASTRGASRTRSSRRSTRRRSTPIRRRPPISARPGRRRSSSTAGRSPAPSRTRSSSSSWTRSSRRRARSSPRALRGAALEAVERDLHDLLRAQLRTRTSVADALLLASIVPATGAPLVSSRGSRCRLAARTF